MTTLEDLMQLLDNKKVKYERMALTNYLLDYGNEFCDMYMATGDKRAPFLNSAIHYKIRELSELTGQLPKQDNFELAFPLAGVKLVVREDYAKILEKYYEGKSRQTR